MPRHVARAALATAWRIATDLTALVLAHGLIAALVATVPMPVATRALFRSTIQAADGTAVWWPLAAALFVGLSFARTYARDERARRAPRLIAAACLAALLVAWPVWNARPIGAAGAVLALTVVLAVSLLVAVTASRVLRGLARSRLTERIEPRIVLVGRAAECRARLTTNHGAATILGYVDVQAPAHRSALGTLGELERVLREQRADTVLVCGSDLAVAARVMRAATVTECEVAMQTPELAVAGMRPVVVRRGGERVLELRPVVGRGIHLALKRAIDIIGAIVLLIVLAPVFAAIAILVRLDSRGPAVFGHRRLGRHGAPMTCYKFRSMVVDAEARLGTDPVLFRLYRENDFKIDESHDTRITRVGRILRRTSLDELPQLWNVLRGEMSLVGPRPIVPDEIQHYNGDGTLLLSCKPGITGAWQIGGRAAVRYPERASLEIEYIERWSLGRDLRILLRTIPVVLTARGTSRRHA